MQTETSRHAAWAAPRPSVSLSVAVLGLGYVGLPVALACTESGFQVVGVDTNPQRIEELRQGKTGSGTHFRLSTALRLGSLTVSEDAEALARADVVFFCVPTPAEEGEAVHAAVRACAEAFARHGRADALGGAARSPQPRAVACPHGRGRVREGVRSGRPLDGRGGRAL